MKWKTMTLRFRIALASCLAALVSVGVTGTLLVAKSRSGSPEHIAIFALGVGLAVLLELFSLRWLTRPLDVLMRSLCAFGSSRMEEPAPEMRPAQRADEVGQLARAFADLRARLTERDARHREDVERIRELATSLEQRVRARTAELEAAQRSMVAHERLAAMGHAAAVISHELKNSLGALGMGVDFLAGEAERSASLRRIHSQVRTVIVRLRTMIDELLVLAHSPRITGRAADLHEVVRGACAACEEQAASSAVALQLRLSGGGGRRSPSYAMRSASRASWSS